MWDDVVPMKVRITMKCMKSIAAASALVWLAGCASAPKIAILEPVGPPPVGQQQVHGPGSLQVYTARQKEPAQVNLSEWSVDYRFRTNPFAYGLAHTDYTICTMDGHILQYVRNATNPADPEPALVSLSPGRYQVQAEAENAHGQTVSVILPVLIEPGRTTIAHLAGNWEPQVPYGNADVVRLPDGQVAGWLASH